MPFHDRVAARGRRRDELTLAVLSVVLLLLGSSCVGGTETGKGTGAGKTEDDRAVRFAGAPQRVTLSGRVHIIYNGEPRFFLVDDRGVSTRLVIDDSVMRAFGGARGIDQKRVTIEGQREDDVSKPVRVLSIELDPKGQ